MKEQKKIKRQLIKNMLYILIVFIIVFLFFDLIIYNKISASIYESIDEELVNQANRYKGKSIKEMPLQAPASDNKNFRDLDEKTISPRIIYVERSLNGEITNEKSIGRIYQEYLANTEFDRNLLEKAYLITVNNNYTYRGINIKTTNSNGEEIYVQLLANVDGENTTLINLSITIILGTSIVIGIAILASYVLSKRALNPIIVSWKKQTEFVQNAAHELRTPLTIIQAKLELLLQEPEKKIIEKSEDITISLTEAKRLSKLIKELMVLARADSNEMLLKKEKTNIDELIRNISIPYADFAKIQNKKIILNLDYKKDLVVDKNKINQVIVILLDNATKYTKDEDTIEIKTYEKESKCIIEVNDTGIGISKEALKHVFERFYREDKARRRKTGGNGLGLAIADSIITAHKGTIKIVQNEPKGTKVIVKI